MSFFCIFLAHLDRGVPSRVDDEPSFDAGDRGHVALEHRPGGTRRGAGHGGEHTWRDAGSALAETMAGVLAVCARVVLL